MNLLIGIINLFCLIFIISGSIMLIKALKHRTEKCPRFPVWNPKRYSDRKNWFTEQGHRYNRIGATMVVFGSLLGLFSMLVLMPD